MVTGDWLDPAVVRTISGKRDLEHYWRMMGMTNCMSYADDVVQIQEQGGIDDVLWQRDLNLIKWN